MFMKNNNTNEHVRRLHHHKPELRGQTKTNSLSMIENRDAQKSLSERGTTEDLWQKMLNKYVLSVIACVLCVVSVLLALSFWAENSVVFHKVIIFTIFSIVFDAPMSEVVNVYAPSFQHGSLDRWR